MDEIKDKKLSKGAKVLLLNILKQGYITPNQIRAMTSAIDLPTIQIEIIDKTEQVEEQD